MVGVWRERGCRGAPTPAGPGTEGRCLAAGPSPSLLCLCLEIQKNQPLRVFGHASCPEQGFCWCLMKSDFHAGPGIDGNVAWTLELWVSPSSTSRQLL